MQEATRPGIRFFQSASPIGGSERWFLGPASPLIMAESRVLERLEVTWDELHAVVQERDKDLQEIENLKQDAKELSYLRKLEAKLLERELLTSIFTALGHPRGTSRPDYYRILRRDLNKFCDYVKRPGGPSAISGGSYASWIRG